MTIIVMSTARNTTITTATTATATTTTTDVSRPLFILQGLLRIAGFSANGSQM